MKLISVSIQNLLTFISIIVSLGIALLSNHQAKVTQELANRPFIAFYLDNIDTVYFSKYLIFKNAGNSPARFISISFKNEHDNEEFLKLKCAFEEITGDILVSNQKLTYSLSDNFDKTLEGEIKYEDLNGKKYTYHFVIKTDLSKMLWNKISNDQQTKETTIENAAAAIIKNLK